MTATNPGYHHLKIGDLTVTALNDGMLTPGTGILIGVTPAEADARLAASFRAVPAVITVNAFLVRGGGRTILVDSGIGGMGGPALGHVAHRLAAIGIAPASVDTVLLTHLHIDHVSGLVDGDGRAAYPNASLVVHADELAHWTDATREAAAPEAAKHAYAAAKRGIAPYAGRIRTVTGGEVAPGISLEPLPGHSPGHSGFMLTSGGDALMIWGDIVHMPGLQFADPGIGLAFDSDVAMAQATRRRILARAAAEQFRVAGMHHEFPGFGHVAAAGAGYAFVPDVWMP